VLLDLLLNQVEYHPVFAQIMSDSVIYLWDFGDIELLCLRVIEIFLDLGPSVVNKDDILTFAA